MTQQREAIAAVGGPYGLGHGTYGPWTTVSSTCAPACVAPSPTSVAISRDAPAERQNVGCPAGQMGEHWQQRSRVENGTRTTSWTCPGATGSPLSSTSESWSGAHGYQRVGNHVQHLRHAELVITSGFVNLSVANAYGTVGNRTLTEATSWTYLAGQSSEWSSSWGPVRGNGSIEITYNGATATVAGGVTAAPRALEARHHSRQATKSSASTASAWSSSSVATPRPTMAQSYAVAWRSTAFCPDVASGSRIAGLPLNFRFIWVPPTPRRNNEVAQVSFGPFALLVEQLTFCHQVARAGGVIAA